VDLHFRDQSDAPFFERRIVQTQRAALGKPDPLFRTMRWGHLQLEADR
jgi:hypothetical protein